MDDQGEDSIAVGSTGTLQSLMEKEMEILQARRSSCSVHTPHRNNYRRSSSGKWYIHTSPFNTSHNISGYGSPAPSSLSPPPPSPHLLPARLVSSLWSDLKSFMLRSPTSVYHSPQLLYHNNFLLCKEDMNELAPLATTTTSCHAPPSPRILSPSPKKNYPKKKVAHPPSPTSRANHPQEKVVADAASYLSQKSLLDVDRYSKERSATGAAAENYPNGTPPLYIICPKQRSAAEALAAPYPNRKTPMNDLLIGREADLDTCPIQVAPSCTDSDQGARKGNRPNALTTGTADPATLKCPTYPKQKVMEGVAASTTRKSSSSSNDADAQKGKQLWEETRGRGRSRKSCSRIKREESGMICMQEYEYWVQKREERACMQDSENKCMQTREERECMQRAILQEGASSPFGVKPSFGGRSNLPPVSVVDLQCCHTTPLERSSRRLSFTRLSSFT